MLALNKSQRYYLSAAIEEARKSTMKQRHGAVIVKSNEIIGRGYNYYIRNPIDSEHAESVAIKSCKMKGISPKGANMYVVRITGKKEMLSNSKPCKECRKLIDQNKLYCVFHT